MMSTWCRQDASDSFGDFAKRRREWAGNPAVRAEYSPGMHTTKIIKSVCTTRQPARGGFPLDSVGRLSLVYGNQSACSMSMSRARSADPECRSGVGEAPTIEFPCCSLPFRDCSRAETREGARARGCKQAVVRGDCPMGISPPSIPRLIWEWTESGPSRGRKSDEVRDGKAESLSHLRFDRYEIGLDRRDDTSTVNEIKGTLPWVNRPWSILNGCWLPWDLKRISLRSGAGRRVVCRRLQEWMKASVTRH
ncbi:hypothetical protein GQ607_005934 [Colletotrichum asianum]|uniref:Uncharacterized protein n=1 Tax=Colletotrichum asianum TaxID=702518 RepID=A0A8H3ZUG6_9PEZI|nr:hypothetical protein GQ607_005934 [Colletotrichum asianum]